jgi:hypothetical protein
MIRESTAQRWWKLFTQLNREELRQDAGRYDVLRLWIEARIEPEIPRILVLRPGVHRGAAVESGPPCEACGLYLTAQEWLAACTVCLTVFHRDCLDRADACALVACQHELVE